MRLLGHNVADEVQGPVYNAFAIASVAGGKELADGPGALAYCLWGNLSA